MLSVKHHNWRDVFCLEGSQVNTVNKNDGSIFAERNLINGMETKGKKMPTQHTMKENSK